METAQIPRAALFALAALLVGSLSARQGSAGEALRKSEQRYRDYIETLSDWLWETGPDHRFTQISVLGFEGQRRVGEQRQDFATDVEEGPEECRLQRTTLEGHQPFRNFRYRTIRPDGSIVYIEATGKPVFDLDGRFLGYRGTSIDVTAAVRAEQVEKALHQTQAELARVMRVTALGELAASSRWQQSSLMPTRASIGWEADRADLDSVREALAAVVKDGDRAAAVITRIRALLSGSSVAHRPCDVAGVIDEVLSLVEPELGRHRILRRTCWSWIRSPMTGGRSGANDVLRRIWC